VRPTTLLGHAKLFVRCWSNEQPIDRRLNEAGAEVEVAGSVVVEADLQAARAFACEPIEAVRQQHAGEAGRWYSSSTRIGSRSPTSVVWSNQNNA